MVIVYGNPRICCITNAHICSHNNNNNILLSQILPLHPSIEIIIVIKEINNNCNNSNDDYCNNLDNDSDNINDIQ